MTTPDFKKYGYRPEADSMNYFSYVNKNWSYGEPYRIWAAPDGEGGWQVGIDWKKSESHDPGSKRQPSNYEHVEGDLRNYTESQSQREKRFDAAMVIERAMREHHSGDVSITGGL